MDKYLMRITGTPHESTQTDYALTESHTNDSCIRKTSRYTFQWENMQQEEKDLIVTGMIEKGNPKTINLADLFMAIEVEVGTMYQQPWSMSKLGFEWTPLQYFQALVKVHPRPKPAISCPKCGMKAEPLISENYTHICKRCRIVFNIKELKPTPADEQTNTNDRPTNFRSE